MRNGIRVGMIGGVCMLVLGLGVARGGEAEVFAPSTLDLRPDNGIPADWTVASNAICVSAAPGRIADVALAVTGRQRPLTDVRVQILPLTGPDGAEGQVIEVPEERIRTVVCSYCPKGGLGGPADWNAPDSYDYMPFALMYDAGFIQVNHAKRRVTVRGADAAPDFLDDRPPLKARSIPANEIRQWYAMIPVPEHNVPPGVYRGTIRVLSGTRVLASVPLELTVLPFKPLPPAKLYGIYENLTLSGLTSDDPRYKLMLEDLVETGIHNPWVTAKATRVKTRDGWHVSFEDIEKVMATRYEVGMDSDFALLVWEGVGFNFYAAAPTEEFVKAARRLRQWWDVRGFKQDLVVYGIDEASGDELRLSAERYRAIGAEGVKVAAACAGGYFAQAGASIKYPIVAGGMNPDDPTVADVAAARAAGATILNYDQPQLIYHDPLLYRVRSGFDMWKNVYDGWYPFSYAWGLNEDHRELRAVLKGGGAPFKTHGVVLVGKDRLIPQVEWPAVRQGIDDVRYATTLAAQVLVARDKKLVPELAAEAEELLRNTGVRADDWKSVETARTKVIDATLRMEKADPALRVSAIASGDVKALTRRVNSWILPDLSFRPFPMGIEPLAQKFKELSSRLKDRPVDAMFAGLEAKGLVREARAAGRLNQVEGVVAMGQFGNLIMEVEQVCLSQTAPKDGGPSPLERNFTVVATLNEGWMFQPDRNNEGISGKWFEPAFTRSNWSPIDVTKFWQRQGRTDWQDLEGSRVGMEGIGWYALTLDAPKEWAGRNLHLWFICDEEAIVWVNGVEVRTRNEGSTIRRWEVPALAPLTGLKPGKNSVVVRVFNGGLAGGLWNGVRIVERK